MYILFMQEIDIDRIFSHSTIVVIPGWAPVIDTQSLYSFH